MVSLTTLVASAALVSSAAVPLTPRLAHDKVVAFPQTVPDSVIGQLYLKYKPWLAVLSGCRPFPAVDKNGNIKYITPSSSLSPPPKITGLHAWISSDGLDTGDGDSSNECDFGSGQIYARGHAHPSGAYGILYAWYFPKDVPSIWLGHRHDWESVVVWVSNATLSATYRGIAISAHGKYSKYAPGDSRMHFDPQDADRPLVAYTNVWPLDHHPDVTDKKGDEQPLLAYESIPQKAWVPLDSYDFGEADFPLGSKNFENLIASSVPDGL